MSEQMKTNRRNFLKTSGVLTVGASMAGTLGVSRSAHAAGSDLIKVAQIGCGGRGNGAIRDRIAVEDNMKVVAVADVFERSAKGEARSLREEEGLKRFVDLPDDRVFWGFDSYKKAIDCLGAGDQVVIATPPGFRPYHYRYAIEKGVHVFMEKPLFTDAPGFRSTMETNKMADEKGLKVCVGLQRRHDPGFKNWVEKIHSGLLGDVTFSRIYWNGGLIWCRPRNPNQTEMEYQVNNWYHFVWLCGDNICEQHVHNIDMGLWMHSKGDVMCHPVKANAQGGRQNSAAPMEILRTAPDFADKDAWWAWYDKNKNQCNRQGQAWDHFFVEYTFGDGAKMFSQCRHINNTFGDVSQFVNGTKGYGGAEGRGGSGWFKGYDGKDLYKDGGVNSGQFRLEHVNHNKAIRENTPMNNAWYGAMSTMTAVFGRMAAFSGKELSWDECVEKGSRYMPEGGPNSWDENPPVMPDKNGFYEGSVAQQGVYNPFA